ncbi:AraC family transcriptional regulator [Phytoactinopolyspora halotolerans]|uniref:AraC family transcriptional regulator n=1 Tax=Phytoactinopolyspora halotolerans TaxID=1981512 RepID=A0A6L9SEX6_9ACTN|nr:AraC family transcriptional regulator [Phytoactinopolyspora halotolerans]NEE03051.1 AraC family transcriptional regulator [Phytoactinopolyspora halotolerans]
MEGSNGQLPLQRYELFHTSNLDHAREVVGRSFVAHRLDLVGRAERVEARMHMARMSNLAASYVAYGGDFEIEPQELGPIIAVQMPLRGYSTIRSGGREIQSDANCAAVVSLSDPLRLYWSRDCESLVLRFERPAVEAHLRDLLGVPLGDPLRFELDMDIAKGYGRSWAHRFRMLVDELDRPDSIIHHPRAAVEFEDWLTTGLLLSQRHNYSAMLDDAGQWSVSNRTVAVVRDLIESHPEWPHTVASLAREAHVAIRTLQKAFMEHLGVPPKEYLTRVRMQRAHDELVAADRSVTTVTSVAAKWGMPHMGRFAREYRKRYGELPSETLAR